MADEILVRDMATTEREFREGLLFAFPEGVSEAAGVFHIDYAGAAMEIHTALLPPRVIALLRLPRLEVRIRFTAGTAVQQQTMLARMDRALQRGGG
jgi:hypothetical protein